MDGVDDTIQVYIHNGPSVFPYYITLLLIF